MTISLTYILSVIALALGVGLAVWARRRVAAVLMEVRSHLLTVHGFVIAVLWWFVTSGALASWIFFNVKVLGADVVVRTPSKSDFADKK